MIKYHRYLQVHPEQKWKKVNWCGLSPIVGVDGFDTVVLLDLVTKLVAIISLTLPVSQREFQVISSGWLVLRAGANYFRLVQPLCALECEQARGAGDMVPQEN